jgi:hypothetical protein
LRARFLKKPIIGSGKSIVALARKLFTIIWHLITHNEFFNHEDRCANLSHKSVNFQIPISVSLDEVLTILRNAAITLKEPDSGLDD